MARMLEAECLRDCWDDKTFTRYRAGKIYVISEDSPVGIHFRAITKFSEKESEMVKDEIEEVGQIPPRPVPGKTKPTAAPRLRPN